MGLTITMGQIVAVVLVDLAVAGVYALLIVGANAYIQTLRNPNGNGLNKE